MELEELKLIKVIFKFFANFQSYSEEDFYFLFCSKFLKRELLAFRLKNLNIIKYQQLQLVLFC
jgi:hypothetical protein